MKEDPLSLARQTHDDYRGCFSRGKDGAMRQSIAEKGITWAADRLGLCWLSLVCWWGGVFGRKYWPVRRCTACNYCGKEEKA